MDNSAEIMIINKKIKKSNDNIINISLFCLVPLFLLLFLIFSAIIFIIFSKIDIEKILIHSTLFVILLNIIVYNCDKIQKLNHLISYFEDKKKQLIN